MLKTPVLFLIYNRLDTAVRVFNSIKNARPESIFIGSDGPQNEGELVKIEKTRKSILDMVDWPCNLNTLFREEHLGCKKAISSSLDWFFKNNEMGIVLEDDCLPSASFFSFCEEMLNKYKDNANVTHINGNNFGSKRFLNTAFSYHFTNYCQAWGWATWKRAWKNYQIHIPYKELNISRESLKHLSWSALEFRKQVLKWDMVNSGAIDTWDYQWHFINHIRRNLAVVPKKNLIINIGIRPDATHTKKMKMRLARLKLENIDFPLVHPDSFLIDPHADLNYKNYMIRTNLKDFIKYILQL